MNTNIDNITQHIRDFAIPADLVRLSIGEILGNEWVSQTIKDRPDLVLDAEQAVCEMTACSILSESVLDDEMFDQLLMGIITPELYSQDCAMDIANHLIPPVPAHRASRIKMVLTS